METSPAHLLSASHPPIFSQSLSWSVLQNGFRGGMALHQNGFHGGVGLHRNGFRRRKAWVFTGRHASPLSGQARRRRPSFPSTHVVIVVHLCRRWVITQDKLIVLQELMPRMLMRGRREERKEKRKIIKYTYKVLQ
jgi:hypothetical protein